MDQYTIAVLLVLVAFPNVISYCHDENGKDQGEYCTKSPKGYSNEVRMLLIGKTGVGKSSTGNTILGFRAFDTKISASSVTAQTQYNETERFGKRLVVVDTPGLFDTNRTEQEILIEMSKWYSLVSPGIHAILLVVQVGRFTEEEQKTVDFFMKVFGERLKDYLIVIFTHKDQLEKENMTIEEFVQTMDESSNLRKMINANKGRYAAIGYKGKEEDRVQEVKQIMSMIEEIGGKDGENYYSNEVFKKVQSLMEENERKRKEEIEKKKKEKMYSEEEVLNLLNSVKTQARVDIVNNNIQEDFLTKLVSTVGNVILATGGFVVRGLGAAASWVGGWFGF